ncbi:hypothetical protein AB0M80_39425 [Amycolatopsis sp. NPDC051045]
MTVVNFAVAMAIPRLTNRFSGAVLLTAGVAATLGRDGLAEPAGSR